MKLKFYCDNKDCTKKYSKQYEYEILIEAVMDENNIANIFCPRCKRPLIQIQSV